MKKIFFIISALFVTPSLASNNFINKIYNEAKQEYTTFENIRENKLTKKSESKFLTNVYGSFLSSRSTLGQVNLALGLSELNVVERIITLHKNNLINNENYKKFFLSSSFDSKKNLKNYLDQPIEINIKNNGFMISSKNKKSACDAQLNIVKVLLDTELEARANPNSALIMNALGEDFKPDGEFHDNYILDYISINDVKINREELSKLQYPGIFNFRNSIVSYLASSDNPPTVEVLAKTFNLFYDHCGLYTNDKLDYESLVKIEYSIVRDVKYE